jgi:hypothetical protein
MTRRAGMCRKCTESFFRQLYHGDKTDKRIWQYCFRYSSWCKLVSRNCLGANLITKEGLKNRDAQEAEERERVKCL